MKSSKPHFNVILYQPEIPNNTGNIGRTCVATNCHLHLIGPLGFDIDEKSVRRAGLDYWKYLELTYYQDYDEFLKKYAGQGKIYYFSTKAETPYTEAPLQQGDGLMFGPETKGLPEHIGRGSAAQFCRIPMFGPTRSLNLANSVAIVVYEGIRQLGLC